MPFEGAGAISSWTLALPENFRQFDYQTISDVVMHISYTAEEDDLLRAQVEELNAANKKALLKILTNPEGGLAQAFSLRRDFSSAFKKLLKSPVNTSVDIEITDRHFPIFLNFLSGYEIVLTRGQLILQTSEKQSVNNFDISINDKSHSDFASLPEEPPEEKVKSGKLKTKDIDLGNQQNIKGTHTIQIVNGGDLSPDDGEGTAVDSQKLKDIILYLEYKLTKGYG